MNKTALKNFAIYARNKLMEDVELKASLVGVTSEGIQKPLEESNDLMTFDIGLREPYKIEKVQVKQRKQLVKELEKRTEVTDYKTAFKGIIEEVAYTWFNRIIALRFMEVNDYMPDHIRVLSSGKKSDRVPEIISEVFDSELNFTDEENDLIIRLKEGGTTKELDELFNFLFIKTCNSMHEYLPELFEKRNDYTELLYNVSFVDTEGVVYKLLNIESESESDFDVENGNGQVEIMGWLYQYYNDERKNEVINIYKGTIKKEDIPAATQLFTTDWVVRYMVDNSLGRYWIERNPNSDLAEKLQFFVTNKNNEIKYIDEKIEPQELTIFDPCMGSGHILVYAFDILMEIYKERGYTERNAAQEIIKHNLYGLDIDERAYQLSYFALIMKARSYDRRFLKRDIKPNVSATEESNKIEKFQCEGITEDEKLNKIGEYLVSTYKAAKELGTLILVEDLDYDSFDIYLDDIVKHAELNLFNHKWIELISPVVKKLNFQAKIMSKKYAVVCTNPPYMNKLQGNLKKFVIDNYKDFGKDLFSTFMRRNFDYCKKDGYLGFMTPFVWMFIKTYEKLRKYIINNKAITTLVQMEYSAFEEATVPICSFVLKNGVEKENGLYLKLSDFKGGMEVQKNKVLEALQNDSCDYFYQTSKENFLEIPGSQVAYWVSEGIMNAFRSASFVGEIAAPKKGLDSADNDRFVRHWFEPSVRTVGFAMNQETAKESHKKWFPLNSGGNFRKWYGNFEKVINWQNDGAEIKAFPKSYIRAKDFYFFEALSWTKISSSKFGIRYAPQGFIFDSAGQSIFESKGNLYYILGFLCTNIAFGILRMLNPTLNYQVGDIANVPIYIDSSKKEDVTSIVKENITLSQTDWDSFEASWNFITHPLITYRDSVGYTDIPMQKWKYKISDAFKSWESNAEKQFNTLKNNEEELNRIFIDIYSLQDELTPKVKDKDVTVCKANLNRDIKSFISYAAGCMFGRYSLDKDGLAYAGGQWDSSKYSLFIPDKENCIPITDEEYFEDDIVTRFIEFVKVVYGIETLEENLDFIADALGGKGERREIIRKYFLKDFFKDHCKTYKKRPIYWLYDSGKQNGFKALVYLHRYTDQTTGIVRVNYLHELQTNYRSNIANLKNELDSNTSAHSRKVAEDSIRKLEKQLDECKIFDEKLGHLANERISIDLDDGVKVNYEKVQRGREEKVMQVLAKIK